MTTLHTASTKHPALLAETLFKLERRGRYAEAFAEVEHLWKDVRTIPDVDELEPREAAEILLRCGCLVGFQGHNEQIQDSQIICKNLLTDAHGRFCEIGDVEKIAECENQLALAYWRTGEFSEAEAYIQASFVHDLPVSSDTRLHSHVIASLLNLACKKYAENIEYGKRIEDNFRQFASDFLNGSLCTNIGISHKNLGNISEALTYFELAKHHHHRSRHKIYLSTVENNLAQLYRETGKFGKAHESIDNATRIFRQIKDKTREGFSLDTKALVYFAESKFAEALKTVEKALSILRKSENSAYLIETLLTKAKILLFLDNFSDAVLSLSDAVVMARVQTGDTAAIRLIQEFETALEAKNTPAKKVIEDGNLELVLPPLIANYSHYRGIWINNTQLESIGLVKGSLAIVVTDKINRGDLIALTTVENNEVSCGFYDADFGIVCLERGDGEPQLFDEKDIKILGKIVGVCSQGKNSEGAMIVDTIKNLSIY